MLASLVPRFATTNGSAADSTGDLHEAVAPMNNAASPVDLRNIAK